MMYHYVDKFVVKFFLVGHLHLHINVQYCVIQDLVPLVHYTPVLSAGVVIWIKSFLVPN